MPEELPCKTCRDGNQPAVSVVSTIMQTKKRKVFLPLLLQIQLFV